MKVRPAGWDGIIRYHGTVEPNPPGKGRPGTHQLIVDRPTIGGAVDPAGQVTIVTAGPGSKAAGITPQAWLVVYDGVVYERVAGNGQRGQCRIINGHWHTDLVELPEDQAAVVREAIAVLEQGAT